MISALVLLKMVEVPLFVIILLSLSWVGHIVYLIYWLITRKKDKEAYAKYLEEEYGNPKNE